MSMRFGYRSFMFTICGFDGGATEIASELDRQAREEAPDVCDTARLAHQSDPPDLAF